MRRRAALAALLGALAAALSTGCGGAQTEAVKLETMPLEEQKAFDIFDEVLKERGYTAEKDVTVELTTKARFAADVRVVGKRVAIEYLRQQDKIEIGLIPPPAAGSRLHVLQSNTVPADPKATPPETIYIFFLDEKNYEYQYNPTSENRADITFTEVQSRLKRDVIDFFTWYETTYGNQP
jgi:hypothetical protein